MAFDLRKLLPSMTGNRRRKQPVSAPLSGDRRESLQRLQIGFLGLGAMVLLVGLASVILDSAQQSQAGAVPEAAPTVAVDEEEDSGSSDPLADAGMMPDVSPDPTPAPAATVTPIPTETPILQLPDNVSPPQD